MLALLNELHRVNKIRPLDYYFAQLINELSQQDDDDTQALATFCAAFASYELGQGHVCFDLAHIDKLFASGGPLQGYELDKLALPPRASWPQHLAASQVVGDGRPMQFELGRVYLSRYQQFEQQVSQRLAVPANISNSATLTSALAELFAERGNSDEINWQKVAAAVAATSPISVISGGPGTGKTTTVTKLLALLIMQAQQQEQSLDIRLVAPTGKAAARLTASIGGALASLKLSEQVKQGIPVQASTIHRLLGVIPGRNEFRHHQENLLHLDVLVVDEASMVDLSLMARLLAALPVSAKLILLGDKDQLASVEAGSVLGDICSFVEQGYSQGRAKQLAQLTGFDLVHHHKVSAAPCVMADNICQLQKSYRFNENSGIGFLARAVNEGRAEQIPPLWDKFADIELFALDQQEQLKAMVLAGYGCYLELLKHTSATGARFDEHVRQILESFNRFKLLVALREGFYGVAGLNEQVENWLSEKNLISLNQDNGPWYIGRPVMISQNDHQAGLFNGDIGVCLANESGDKRIYFELADGKVHHFLPSRLPTHQTVFAMTVHKSQGSEFDHTVMMLPEAMNPVLTRELVYTGITRAKKKLSLFAPVHILNQAVRQKTQRASGLIERLAAK
ncbi:exodeoxyribonuclease V subunit alpha [Motilimonas cestriensis]|uniref:exodeoxyribonuclease V subunit alpha n=1 Tax=Motilimonas cestriensis TaxID=2742685 RepID=UPI003DA6CD37